MTNDDINNEQEDSVRKSSTKVMMNSALRYLSPGERKIMSLNYGFEDGHEYTAEEIAAMPEFPDDVEEVKTLIWIAVGKMFAARHLRRSFVDSEKI